MGVKVEAMQGTGLCVPLHPLPGTETGRWAGGPWQRREGEASSRQGKHSMHMK